jgi:glycosyltransferase involved in cell wall biosynthesis
MNTEQPLVSIIIPTFNRAQLIGETLDSVLAQTYKNWECIVVDDGSSDNTAEVMQQYLDKDPRFHYHHRPADRPKGANACRNYGFGVSKGEYIIWFDSDDIMTANHISVKVNAISKTNFDYVITKTKYLNSDIVDELYNFQDEDISCHNYITQKVNWLTYDVLMKRQLAEKIRFNEILQSGQEFNYFSKMTYFSSNACLLNEYVTLRRFHENSIRGPLRADKDLLLESIYLAHWHTYLDLYSLIEKKTRKYLIMKCIVDYFKINKYYRLFSFKFFLAIQREYGIRKAIYYTLSSITNLCIGKGYYFTKQTRKL